MQNWHLLYNTDSGKSVSIGTVIADPLPADLTALPLTDAEGEGLQNGTLKWDEATRSLIPTPPPAFSPEDWTAQHFTSAQIIALQRFEFALQAAGKPLGPQMQALKTWLESMLLESVDPTPRTFAEPPCGYGIAAAEAIKSQIAQQPTQEETAQ